MLHRNLEEWRRLRRPRDGNTAISSELDATLEDVRREYEPSPVNEKDEVTDFMIVSVGVFGESRGRCGRMDAWPTSGHFRGAGASWTSTSRVTEGWGESPVTCQFHPGSGSPDAPTSRPRTR